MAGGYDPALEPGEVVDEIEDAQDEGQDGESRDDLEGAADESGDDGRPDAEDEGEAQGQVGRRGRSSETIRSLRARAQQAEAERERDRQNFQRQLDELRQQRSAPDPAIAAREEAEALARAEMEGPAAISRYYAEKSERRIAQALQNVQFTTQDRLDRQYFESQASSNPMLARVAPKVEEVLASERAQGRNTDRLVVAKYLLGEELLARQQQTGQQRRQAGRRVAAQTVRPTNGAGDAPRPTGRQGDDSYEAALRRVRGVPL